MKKQLMGILAVLLFCNCQLFAQVKDSIISLQEIKITQPAKVSNQLDKAFKQSFPGAENVKWYKQDKDYLAKFIQNDLKHNALYQKNGYLKYDVSFGFEQHLPKDVRQMIQASYDDFKITRAVNVKEGDRDIWVVNLEGQKHFVILRVEEKELEEVERFTKSM